MVFIARYKIRFVLLENEQVRHPLVATLLLIKVVIAIHTMIWIFLTKVISSKRKPTPTGMGFFLYKDYKQSYFFSWDLSFTKVVA